MKDGFVKVAAVSPSVKVADCEFNASQICEGIQRAFDDGANVVVFPELSVCGYTCGDLLLQNVLLQSAENAVEKIKDFCTGKQIFVVIGAPVVVCGKLYNCAVAIYDGKILGIVPKRNIPSYAEFYEGRYFESGDKLDRVDKTEYCGETVDVCSKAVFRCRNMKNLCIGIEICEDMWIADGPADRLCAAGATVICNLSASDETVGKDDYRRLLIKSASGKCNWQRVRDKRNRRKKARCRENKTKYDSVRAAQRDIFRLCAQRHGAHEKSREISVCSAGRRRQKGKVRESLRDTGAGTCQAYASHGQ